MQYKNLARRISLVENNHPEADAILKSLKIQNTPVVGITGPPGAGKSTLVNQLLKKYLEQNKKIGVLLIDPSSPFHQGALLGDRVRMSEHFLHQNIFIRSIATRGSLGGLSDKILEICDVMKHEDFDIILIETVGVGQSEIEIAGLADITIILLVPEAGDEIQHMKSGVMEIGNLFIVNKADRPNADIFSANLVNYLKGTHTHYDAPVIKTEAHNGLGIDMVIETLQNMKDTEDSNRKIYLYTQKALQLIKNKKMQSVDKNKVMTEIQELILRKKDFNMYQFIEQFF